MLGKRQIVFDIEADAVDATKIHCLCYQVIKGESGSITDYNQMRAFLTQPDIILIGHKIKTYDLPVLEKLLGIKITCDAVDTLTISWYIETKRVKHGLEVYGEYYGVPKPKISDWKNLSVEEYIHRCSEDVKINKLLWEDQFNYLTILYDYDDKEIYRFLKYLEFKYDCVAEEEEIGLNADMDLIYQSLQTLQKQEEEKVREIEAAMPMVEIKKKKAYNNAVINKYGDVAEKGDLFFEHIVAKDEGVRRIDVLEKVVGHKEPNADSHVQIKNWLYSLGWEPQHIQYKRNKVTGEVKEIPQIGSKDKDGTLCPSIKMLYEREPKLELLEGLSIISHRKDLFHGFMRDARNGRLYPSAKGLTNTLRLKHSVIVNLPDLGKKWGEQIRGSLIADKGHVLCGSDLAGIEDSTKRHYIYKYDPAYVEEMNTPGYDPHLKMAVRAKMLTEEQAEEHKLYDKTDGKEGVNHSKVRKKAKTTNFAATYKVGAKTLSRNSGMPISECEELLKVYWELNGAILKVEEALRTKNVRGQDWLKNPVSGFWYSLRSEKDKFSTLNQGTAVYVFDVWLGFVRRAGVKVALQMHDEILFNVPEGKEEETRNIITEAINKVNNKLKLNVTVGCSVKFGKTYAAVH